MAMAVWALGMASCGNQPSKEFKAMEEEVSSIETKICEMTDCDWAFAPIWTTTGRIRR